MVVQPSLLARVSIVLSTVGYKDVFMPVRNFNNRTAKLEV